MNSHSETKSTRRGSRSLLQRRAETCSDWEALSSAGGWALRASPGQRRGGRAFWDGRAAPGPTPHRGSFVPRQPTALASPPPAMAPEPGTGGRLWGQALDTGLGPAAISAVTPAACPRSRWPSQAAVRQGWFEATSPQLWDQRWGV